MIFGDRSLTLSEIRINFLNGIVCLPALSQASGIPDCQTGVFFVESIPGVRNIGRVAGNKSHDR